VISNMNVNVNASAITIQIPGSTASTTAIANSAASVNTYYTLSFSYTFKHSGDKVYFAYSRPYTVTMVRSLLADIKASLASQAKEANVLQPDELQKRIKAFVKEDRMRKSELQTIKKRRPQGAKQTKQRMNKWTQSLKHSSANTLVPEKELVHKDVLKEYLSQEKNSHSPLLHSQDYEIETDTFIYRKETLSHTLSGFPVDLLTITAYQ
jgi:hypothetical protein